ncbi:MAG: hypothetical protein AAF663_00790 [Planctomycetota bacterium]
MHRRRARGSLHGSAANVLYECGDCGQRVSAGQIAVGPLRRDPDNGTPIVDLAFYCDHCNHLQTWSEMANAKGHPTGASVGEPRRIRGDAVRRFCQRFPEKTQTIV